MQFSFRLDKRPGESHLALDGKNLLFLVSGCFLIYLGTNVFHSIGMFVICPSASLNVGTEPQSEIGRNRGKKNQRQSIFVAQCSFGALERRPSLGSRHRSASFIKFVGWCAFPNRLDYKILSFSLHLHSSDFSSRPGSVGVAALLCR